MTPQPSEQPTPRTAAGRKLLTDIKAAAGDDGYWWEDILAIEAEASATELTGDGTGTALPAAPDPVASPPDPRRWPTVDDAVEALAAEIFTEIPRALSWSGAAEVAKENCREEARQRFGEVAGLLNAESRTVREYVQSLWPVASPLDVERLHRIIGYAGEGIPAWTHKPPPESRVPTFLAFNVRDVHAAINGWARLEGQPVAEEPRPNQEETP